MILRGSWRTRRNPAYGGAEFLGDAVGGLTAALIALPYGLAMASLMGLPPVYGILTSLLTTPVTFLLGRNPVLIGGTSTVTVPFLMDAVRDYGIAGAAKITLIAAVFMMGFSVLQAGRYILRIPHTVVAGFSCGIGAMMVISQLRTVLGLPAAAAGAQASSLQQLAGVLGQLQDAHAAPAVLAAIVVAGAFAASRYSGRLPAPFLGVLASMAFAWAAGWRQKEVGRLPLVLPDFARFTWSSSDIDKLALPGLGLALAASVNLLVTSRVVEHFRGRHRAMRPSDADAELGAYGISNVVAGIFGAPASVGIPARSLANVRCGGTTRLSNLFHGLALLACMRFWGDWVAHIPLASLAGVTVFVGICLLDWSAWRRLPRMRRVDAAAFALTALGTLAVNAVAAAGAGTLLYGLHWVYRRAIQPARESRSLEKFPT